MATQQDQAADALRELILGGVLGAGSRVTETALAERLGLSRTPVRHALTVAARQGWLSRCGSRGYRVSGFSIDDMRDALDVRGILEGVAVRTVAEQGLAQCLAEGDRLLADGAAGEAAFLEMDVRLHALLVKAARNPALDQLLAPNVHAVAAEALALQALPPAVRREELRYAHRQHHALARALEDGDSVRAEALMREHLHAARECLDWRPGP
ncbi:GntR family transcriptional regulator [Herbaspirillum sp. SJZ099]|uniref:GntR family transcriptional regulator n=1 Tax=Herbaspirillum sp. SJZ099 TaxID=2572916 RepID=UPI00119FC79C|nr:GntR family transcriptional regulator [Herbaspirillum sp. SJZ099]TWC65129.1 GntR family transcriptional regulator [Herbaspirillum sp. SJZ099]